MLSTPDAPAVTQPAEYAQQKSPDGGAVKSTTGRRTEDRLRAGSQTILTGGFQTGGGFPEAQTDKKTLLGQ
mgnify:CR=1 FL=1